MTYSTYADLLQPSEKRSAILYNLAFILGGSLLIGLSAQIAIPLWFTPVPITGQTLAVRLIGASYGSKRGALCLLAYLAEGLAGLPVFSGGQGGLAHAIGPTGGYLVGFLAAAYVMGRLSEQGWDRRWRSSLAAMLIGGLIIFAFGLAWLGFFVGFDQVLARGLLPFIPGELIKAGFASALLPVGWKLAGRDRH